jgi:hypothetical protein
VVAIQDRSVKCFLLLLERQLCRSCLDLRREKNNEVSSAVLKSVMPLRWLMASMMITYTKYRKRRFFHINKSNMGGVSKLHWLTNVEAAMFPQNYSGCFLRLGFRSQG